MNPAFTLGFEKGVIINMLNKHSLLLLCLLSPCSLAASYKTEHFTIEFDDNVPVAVVEQLADNVNKDRKRVLAYLGQSLEYKGTPIKEHLIVYISKTRRTPFQDWNTIHIPEGRVLQAFADNDSDNNQSKTTQAGMAIIHELTHVYAVSAYRKQIKNGDEDRFYDDGLAVFLQHRFGKDAQYPDFGKDLYPAVAQASLEYGGLIPLGKAEEVRHSAKTGLGRKLAYLQEGAFSQFLIENYGLDAYLKIYQGADLKTVTGKNLEQLEKDWSALIDNFKA
jgi:hypothetical protein